MQFIRVGKAPPMPGAGVQEPLAETPSELSRTPVSN